MRTFSTAPYSFRFIQRHHVLPNSLPFVNNSSKYKTFTEAHMHLLLPLLLPYDPCHEKSMYHDQFDSDNTLTLQDSIVSQRDMHAHTNKRASALQSPTIISSEIAWDVSKYLK